MKWLLLIIILLSMPVALANIDYSVVRTGIANQDPWISVALDSNGFVHLTYENLSSLNYCNNKAGTWDCQEISIGGDATSIAVDSADRIHISYQNFTDLDYCNNTGGSWGCAFVETNGSYNSIAIDSSDMPHISHYDYTDDMLRYCHIINSSWNCTSIEDSHGYTGIAIDSNDDVHIADEDSSDMERYCTNSSGAWVCETPDVMGDCIGSESSSLALDDNDKAHYSATDYGNDICYNNNTGGSLIGRFVETGLDNGMFTSLALDNSSKAHIVYYNGSDASGDYSLRYCTNKDGPWNCTDIGRHLGNLSSAEIDNGRAIAIKEGRLSTSSTYSPNITIVFYNRSSTSIVVATISNEEEPVMDGNCSDCQSCNQEIAAASAGSKVYLDTNITGPMGNCLDFNGRDNITFSCRGHFIWASGGGGYGIYLNSSSGGSNYNTIRDCHILNFSIGIYSSNSNRTQILNDSISDVNYGVRLSSSSDSTIKDSTISGASATALQFTNTAIGNLLWNSQISSSTVDIESSGANTSNTVLNSSFDDSNLNFNDYAMLYVKWFFRAFVNDTYSNNVSGAVVNVTDRFSTPAYSLTTGASGYTAEKNITEYTQNTTNSSSRLYYNDYLFYAYNSTKFSSRQVNITGSGTVVLTFDYTPPVISGITNQTGNQSAVISWTTDDLSNSSIMWGNATDNLTWIQDNSTLSTSHSFNLTGLDDNTTYYFNITSCNDQSLCTEQGPYTFTTNTTPVTVPDLNKTLAIYVNGTSSSALSGVNITIKDNASIAVFTSLTNSSGLASVELPGNITYSIRLTKSGYVGQQSTHNLTADITLDFTLQNQTGTLPSSSKFTGNSTDLELVPDLTDVSSLTLESSNVSLRYLANVNVSGLDLDSSIDFSDSLVSVDSSVLSNLNVSAEITMHGVTCPAGTIYYTSGYNTNISLVYESGTDCEAAGICTLVSCTGITLVFNVSHFSSFAAGTYANLSIWDQTDSITRYTGDNVTFFANYSSSGPLNTSSSYCEIMFNNTGTWSTPVNMTLNGSSGYYEYPESFNASGNYSFNVFCDALGYDNLTATDYFIINQSESDSIPPVITISYPANDTNLSYSTTWTWINLTTDENASCRYNFTDSSFDFAADGTDFTITGATVHSFNLSGLSSGSTYTLYYRCNDSSGNIDTASAYHVFSTDSAPDMTAPVISSLQNSTTTSSFALTFSTDDSANVSVSYGTSASSLGSSVSNSSLSTSHAATLSSLSDNTTYYFNITVCNSEGYCAEYGTYDITTDASADITPPVISAIGSSSITGSGATISWTTDEASDSLVKYGTSSGTYTLTKTSATDTTSHSLALTGLSEETTYYYVVNSTDPSSNSAESSEYSLTTHDSTPPVISSVASSSIGTTTATITWTTNEASDSQVRYGTSSGSYTLSKSSASLVTSHSISLTGLDDDRSYYYVVVSNDSSANSVQSSQSTFVTADGTAPVISITYPVDMSTTVTDSKNVRVTTTTDEAAMCKVSSYKIGASTISTAKKMAPSTSSNLTHTAYFNATGETTGYDFFFTVTCTDSSGNSGSETTYFKLVDTTAPTGAFASPTPADGAYTSNDSLLAKLTTSETPATGYPKISFDSGSNTSMTKSGSYYVYSKSSLDDGEHNITVYIADAFGNVRSYERSYTVDTTEPSIDDTYPEDSGTVNNCMGVVLNATLDEEGDCTYELFEHLQDKYDDCTTTCDDKKSTCYDDADGDSDKEDTCDEKYDTCNNKCADEEYDSLSSGSMEETYNIDDCKDGCKDDYDTCVDDCKDQKAECLDNAINSDDKDKCSSDYDDCKSSCSDDQDDCDYYCEEDSVFVYSKALDSKCYDDSEYLATFTCDDLASNEVVENVTFTVDDNTPPKIVYTYPNGTISDDYANLRVNTDEYATCRFSQVNIGFSQMNYTMLGTSQQHTFKYTGLKKGAYTFYVLCNDTRGNIMTQPGKISFAVDTTSTTTSSGSAASSSVASITSGSSATFTIDKGDIPITSIILKVSSDVTDAKIDVEKITDTTNLKAYSQPVYEYLQVDKTGISNKDISSVSLLFKVPLKWILDQGLDEDSISLFRYTTSWEEIPTRKTGKDLIDAYYEADTDGLSLFAISAREPVTTAAAVTKAAGQQAVGNSASQKASSSDPQNNTGKSPAVEQPTQVQDAGSSYLWLIILICVLVVGGGSAGFYVYKSHRHPQQNSFAESQKQPTRQAAGEEHSVSESALPPAAASPVIEKEPLEEYPDDELAQYITNSLKAGQELETIKDALLGSGYAEEDIKAKFTEMNLIDELGDYIRSAIDSGQEPESIKRVLVDAGYGPQDVVNKFVDMGLLDDQESRNSEIQGYINDCIQSGLAPGEIRKLLLDAGHAPELIDGIMQGMELDAYQIKEDAPAEEDVSDTGNTAFSTGPTPEDRAETDRQIIDYIKSSSKYGMPAEQITQQLTDQGYDPDYVKVMISHAVGNVEGQKPAEDAPMKRQVKHDEVMDYIKDALDEKIPRGLIIAELVKAGHTRLEVKKRFAEIDAAEKKLKKDLKEFVKKEKKAKRKKKEIRQQLLDSGIDPKMIKKVL